MTRITQGRFTANITRNSGELLVIVTRDGDCLHGIPSRSYASDKAAERGALKMLARAQA